MRRAIEDQRFGIDECIFPSQDGREARTGVLRHMACTPPESAKPREGRTHSTMPGPLIKPQTRRICAAKSDSVMTHKGSSIYIVYAEQKGFQCSAKLCSCRASIWHPAQGLWKTLGAWPCPLFRGRGLASRESKTGTGHARDSSFGEATPGSHGRSSGLHRERPERLKRLCGNLSMLHTRLVSPSRLHIGSTATTKRSPQTSVSQ